MKLIPQNFNLSELLMSILTTKYQISDYMSVKKTQMSFIDKKQLILQNFPNYLEFNTNNLKYNIERIVDRQSEVMRLISPDNNINFA